MQQSSYLHPICSGSTVEQGYRQLTVRRMDKLLCMQDDQHIHSVANSTASRIHAVAEYLTDLRPGSQVVLVGLLPRGDLTLSSDQHLAQPSK